MFSLVFMTELVGELVLGALQPFLFSWKYFLIIIFFSFVLKIFPWVKFLFHSEIFSYLWFLQHLQRHCDVL